MSLRLRLALVVGVTFAVVVIGCVYAVRVSAGNELRGQVDTFLVQRARDPRYNTDFERRPPDVFPGRGPSTGPVLEEPDAIVQLLDANGTVLRAASPALPVSAQDRALAQAPGATMLRTETINGTPYRVLTKHTDSGAVQIARSIKETNNVLSSLDIRLLLIAIGGTLFAALAAWLIARRIVRPVEQLTGATETVAATQDLTSTIPVERRDELGRLAESFNTMLVALRSSREQQQRLIVDASHELRTPLTALRTNIELLRRQRASGSELDEVLGEAQFELEELSDLVSELVELATDARADEPETPVDLGEVTQRVAARFRRRTNRELPVTLDAPAVVTAREAAIERAVSNLVENACKFTPEDRSIDIVVRGGVIDVRDRGPGIDAADRAHVFDRFYRAPAARTMTGSGLGLSIVKQIVDLHGGTVEVLPRDGGGTIARVTLPA
jgi:two-component system sensor histidine kinase MprB